MKAEFINPFIDAVVNVLSTMAQVNPNPGKPFLKETSQTYGVVTGLIGMAGSEVNGNMILSFELSPILTIVNNMLMESFTELNDEVVDAVGEITNMVSGGAKKNLAELGHKFDMATPVMIQGKEVELKQLSEAPVISIPFSIPEGQFWVEANLASVKR